MINTSMEGEQDNSKNRKKKLLKKAPNAPKRFKSAYIYFVMAKMDEMKKNYPEDAKVTDIMKDLAAIWKKMPATERRPYEDEAQSDKSRYFDELSRYSGPMQVPNRRQKKPEGAPKRAMSAFLIFSQKLRSELRKQNPELKNTDISGLLAEKWRNTPDEEKRPYLEQELHEREMYHSNMTKWKEDEVVRVQENEEAMRERTLSTIDFLDLPSSFFDPEKNSGDTSSSSSSTNANQRKSSNRNKNKDSGKKEITESQSFWDCVEAIGKNQNMRQLMGNLDNSQLTNNVPDGGKSVHSFSSVEDTTDVENGSYATELSSLYSKNSNIDVNEVTNYSGLSALLNFMHKNEHHNQSYKNPRKRPFMDTDEIMKDQESLKSSSSIQNPFASETDMNSSQFSSGFEMPPPLPRDGSLIRMSKIPDTINGQHQQNTLNSQLQNSTIKGQLQYNTTNGQQHNTANGIHQHNGFNGQLQNSTINGKLQYNTTNGQQHNTANGQHQHNGFNGQLQNSTINGKLQYNTANGQFQQMDLRNCARMLTAIEEAGFDCINKK